MPFGECLSIHSKRKEVSFKYTTKRADYPEFTVKTCLLLQSSQKLLICVPFHSKKYSVIH